MSNNNDLMSIDDQTLVSIMNKRHRTAAKSFKSPPQPRFCIKDRCLISNLDVFINILSYSRIANQLSEFDPVPLYGGIAIRSYNSIKNSFQQQQQLSGMGENVSPPLPPVAAPPTQLIFAVMASPEVLKKTGRNCPNTMEMMNLVELMCEFCEAMNPGLKLSKKPQILKDRDLTGELKDIWTAVQNFREKEKSGISDIVVYTEFGPDSCATSSANILTPIAKDFDASIEACMKNETLNNNNSSCSSSEILRAHQQHHQENSDEYHENDAEKCLTDSPNVEITSASSENDNFNIDKLSIGDKKSKNSNANVNENESSEKTVKVHNQKNKESQHHFFPKFLSSSKDTKDKDKDKEKEKDKSKDESESETKVKTKVKTLNFFRRNKSSTGSPTHNNNNNNNSNANSVGNE